MASSLDWYTFQGIGRSRKYVFMSLMEQFCFERQILIKFKFARLTFQVLRLWLLTESLRIFKGFFIVMVTIWPAAEMNTSDIPTTLDSKTLR